MKTIGTELIIPPSASKQIKIGTDIKFMASDVKGGMKLGHGTLPPRKKIGS
jgi:hypothetical protein